MNVLVSKDNVKQVAIGLLRGFIKLVDDDYDVYAGIIEFIMTYQMTYHIIYDRSNSKLCNVLPRSPRYFDCV